MEDTMAKTPAGRIAAAILVGMALTGPAAAQDDATLPPREKLGKGNDCTWARTIDNWTAVDRDHIIVEGTGTERFLVRFSGACIANPAFETAIGVYSRDSRLCPYGGDALILDGQRCTILNIWKLPDPTRTAAD